MVVDKPICTIMKSRSWLKIIETTRKGCSRTWVPCQTIIIEILGTADLNSYTCHTMSASSLHTRKWNVNIWCQRVTAANRKRHTLYSRYYLSHRYVLHLLFLSARITTAINTRIHLNLFQTRKLFLYSMPLKFTYTNVKTISTGYFLISKQ